MGHHPTPTREGRRETLKGLALAAMLVDHLGKTVWIDQLDATHLVGRFALPAFLWLVAIRLGERPERGVGYLRWLLPWGLVASLPWRVVAGAPGGCILLTFAAGVVLDLGLRHRSTRALAAAATLAAPFVVGDRLEFGGAVVAAVPLAAALVRRGHIGGATAVVAFASAAAQLDGPPLAAALAGGAALGMPALADRLPPAPRAPRWLWYAVYTGHLALLWAWMVLALGYPAHWILVLGRAPP